MGSRHLSALGSVIAIAVVALLGCGESEDAVQELAGVDPVG